MPQDAGLWRFRGWPQGATRVNSSQEIPGRPRMSVCGWPHVASLSADFIYAKTKILTLLILYFIYAGQSVLT